MRRLILVLGIVLQSALIQAATVLHTEVSPKPVHLGQTAYFRVSVGTASDTPALAGDFSILVDGQELTIQFSGKIERSPETTDYFFTAIAPSDFDWRQVHVRLGGGDYPAGPDDPYMICDAPFRVKSASSVLPVSAAFHDAHLDDVELQFVEIINDANGQLLISYPIWEWISTPYHSYLFEDLTAADFGCTAGDTAWVRVVLHCNDHDWPWIPEEYTFTQHLKVRAGRDLPAPAGWYYGDVHTHSQYTNNIYEYGGPLEMFAAAAEAIGLSFATISDHSSDFDANGTLWQQMAADCQSYSTAAVHLFPAEEICLDDNEINNYIDNRIHFLNYSNYFIRGPEAPITFSLDTSEEFTYLSQALAQMEAGGGFGYGAHPFQAYDPFVALFGLAMMTWSGENYDLARGSSAYCGMELLNERNRYRKNVSYWYELNPFPWEDNPNWAFENTWITSGIAQWDEFLSAGLTQNLVAPALLPQKQFISAGSDCHGDFNYRTYNIDPIFFDVYATDNAFGNLRTAVYVPGYAPGQLPPLPELMTAYRLGHSMVTDGPFMEIGLDANADDDLTDPQDVIIGGDKVLYSSQMDSARVLVRWESSADWGVIQSVVVYRGEATTGANPIAVWSANPGGYSGQQSIPLSSLVSSPSGGWIYLRAAATGFPLPDDARRAYTNPLWLRVDVTPTASITIEPQVEPLLIPTNGGSFEYTIGVQNHTGSPASCNVWIEAILPTGSIYPLVNAPITLPGSYGTSRLRTQSVPPSAPAGDYVLRANIGVYPSPWSSDALLFSKMGATGAADEVSPWRVDNSPIIALSESEAEQLSAKRAESLDLHVSPNPFNATTAFVLDLPTGEYVNLALYDLAGRKIRDLLDAWCEPGSHRIIWNAEDLAAGVYLYQLEAGGKVTYGKVVALK